MDLSPETGGGGTCDVIRWVGGGGGVKPARKLTKTREDDLSNTFAVYYCCQYH